MKKILQLTTYPIVKPLHGGQIRVAQIRKFFEKRGCIVKTISASEMSHIYYGDDDFLLDEPMLKTVTNTPFCTDFATSQICSNGKFFDFLSKKVLSFDPDIIFIEQVWLGKAVERLKEKNLLKKDIKVVYSSQNVEYKTKESLLKAHTIFLDDIVKQIYELEKEVVGFSDVVISCTKEDSLEFEKMGAKMSLICNNGVRKVIEDKKTTEELLADLQGRKYLLFVGSAYPPNALGFWEMMGESLAWLPPSCLIISAGGVSKILSEYQSIDAELYSFVNLDRLKMIGYVSEKLLSSLLYNASVIILPITVGGGSNLKTAEAIASNRPVVASSVACRGFDFVDKLSNFKVVDDKQSFIDATQKFLLKSEQTEFSQQEKKLRTSVHWENTLKPLEALI